MAIIHLSSIKMQICHRHSTEISKRREQGDEFHYISIKCISAIRYKKKTGEDERRILTEQSFERY